MTSKVIALVPAKARSTGIIGKNWKPLAGTTPVKRAVNCARAVREIERIIVSTDAGPLQPSDTGALRVTILQRPDELATDTVAMVDVVKHALAEIPGDPDDIWLLVQPTQVLREPKHLKAAIALLKESGADSVVSVVDVGICRETLHISGERLYPWSVDFWSELPTTRQGQMRAYKRDGTVYVFWRKTVTQHGTFYGLDVRPLIIPPEETQALDTPQDWAEAERRLRERATCS